MVENRKTDQSQLVAHKKTKAEEHASSVGNQLITSNSSGKEVFKAIKRTSLLSQPIMQLTGHQGAVLTCQFNNQYSSSTHACQPLLASAGTDKAICKFLHAITTSSYYIHMMQIQCFGMHLEKLKIMEC